MIGRLIKYWYVKKENRVNRRRNEKLMANIEIQYTALPNFRDKCRSCCPHSDHILRIIANIPEKQQDNVLASKKRRWLFFVKMETNSYFLSLRKST